MSNQVALTFFEAEKQAWIDEARWTVRKLAEKQPYVTSDDVHKLCPLPKNLHPNTMGAVFNNEFKSEGFVQSKRREAKGRWIQKWVAR